MKYAVIKIVNGSYQIVSEWQEIEQAIVNYHSVCTTLWNSADVKTACIAVIDEKMRMYKNEQIERAEG